MYTALQRNAKLRQQCVFASIKMLQNSKVARAGNRISDLTLKSESASTGQGWTSNLFLGKSIADKYLISILVVRTLLYFRPDQLYH